MIRVFIVESSPPSRQRLARKLVQTGEIRVVGDAGDAVTAREQIDKLDPDVVVLDGELPSGDGTMFLQHLTHHRPSRVVLYSDVTSLRGEAAARLLAAGVSSVVSKSGVLSPNFDAGQELLAAVRGAAASMPSRSAQARVLAPAHRPAIPVFERRIIGVGASTGGTAGVESLVGCLAVDTPPIVIVQHLPEYVLSAFAERLNQRGNVRVDIATDGMLLEEGAVVLAPSDRHLTVERVGGLFCAQLTGGPKVNGRRPAVDLLFSSLARAAGAGAVGVLMSGTGRDGAAGMLSLRTAGARTMVQDESTSAVWGMPKAAIELGAAQEILALNALCSRVAEFAGRSRPTIAAAG